MHLPADYPRPQVITCVNNLKQTGVCVKAWSLDNQNRFPFQVATNQGGTLEFRAPGKDGFDSNTPVHFEVMSNELNTPRLLVCPKDKVKKPSSQWRNVNVTYRLRTSADVCETNPAAILAVCPIDGNILRCDGSVIGVGGNPQSPIIKKLAALTDAVRFHERTAAALVRAAIALAISVTLLITGTALKRSRPPDQETPGRLKKI